MATRKCAIKRNYQLRWSGTTTRYALLLLLVLPAATLTPTARAVTLINPNKLPAPSEPRCVDLKQPLLVDAYETIFKWHWIYGLASGPTSRKKSTPTGLIIARRRAVWRNPAVIRPKAPFRILAAGKVPLKQVAITEPPADSRLTVPAAGGK